MERESRATAWEMTREYMGPEATEDDLYRFRAACANYLSANLCSEAEATDAIWGDGDCWARVIALTPDWDVL